MLKVINNEIRRNIKKIEITFFLLFLLIQYGIFHFGIKNYNIIVEQESEFQQVEKETTECFINYMQYSGYGFRIKVTPSPLYALFYNNTTFTDMIATVDNAIKVKLDETKQGQNVFKKPTNETLDLSWYLLKMGSLLVMAWSFFTFRDKEYLRYLHNFMKAGSIYAGVLIGRIIIIAGAILSVFLLILIQFALNSIPLKSIEIIYLLIFLGILFLMMILLMLICAGLGAINNTKKGVIVMVSIWLIFINIWPGANDMVFSYYSKKTNQLLNKSELKKLKIVSKFEKEALKNTQRYKNDLKNQIKSDMQMSERFPKSELVNIEKIDLEIIANTENMAKKFHIQSTINPVTFLKSVDNELSSCGYMVYLENLKSNLEKRRGFNKFIHNKRYKENYTKIVPYIPIEKTVMKAKSSLPHYFLGGLAILAIYLICAVLFSFYRFKRLLCPKLDKTTPYADITIDSKNGNYQALGIEDDDLKNILLNHLHGIENRIKSIVINGTELKLEKRDVVYIPSINALDNRTPIHRLFKMAQKPTPDLYKNKKVNHLKNYEKFKLMIEIAGIEKKNTIFILDHSFYGVRLVGDARKVILELIEKVKENNFIIEFYRNNMDALTSDYSKLVERDNAANSLIIL